MAAQNGTLVLIGKQSGRTYNVDFYTPDAASTYWTFNNNGAAASTSPNTWRLPETCQIYDVSIATAPTATAASFFADSTPIVGSVIRYANQLTSLPNRQRLNIVVPGGALLQVFNYA